MKDEMFKMLGLIAIVAVIVSIIIAMLATIGAVRFTDGCFYRYNFDKDGNLTNMEAVAKTVKLRGDANYTHINRQLPEQNSVEIIPDPVHYGEWLNTDILAVSDQIMDIEVKGDLSLCRAYIPRRNLQTENNVDIKGARIPIPRIEERAQDPVPLIFNATTDEWRNIAEVYNNDHVVVFISPDQKTPSRAQASIQRDVINNKIVEANCAEGGKKYSPICGRYSIYSGEYAKSCYWKSECKRKYKEVCQTVTGLPWGYGAFGECAGKRVMVPDGWIGCCSEKYATAPEPYLFDGSYTSSWSDNINNLITDINIKCSGVSCFAPTQEKKHPFWFSANNAAGLLYRFDTSEAPNSAKRRGSGYAFAKVLDTQGDYVDTSRYKTILDATYTDRSKAYLQYRFISEDGKFAGNTGGYVLSVKQTKCKRSNGVGKTDVFIDRGGISYMIVPGGEDPNKNKNSYSANSLLVNKNGIGQIKIQNAPEGSYIWMRINNAPEDYKDATGQYLVNIKTSIPVGQFADKILNPLFTKFKEKVRSTAETLFKNMTCYNGGASENFSCINFFLYIKAMLTLYIALYGMMFLLGMVKISQTDLVIRVVKIAIVAGLMNGSTFNWFNTYVFDFVTRFSDQIIANMSGYNIASIQTKINHPFLFIDQVMSKILFSKTFLGQVLALMSLGISGILYFIIIFVALVIFLITVLRAITVYIMAFLSIAILIGIAPLFLTFMLFESTWYLFDNWVRFTFRYMIEPVVLLAGVIILSQLFTIYLDTVLGFSVCWKCALSFRLPFPNIPGFSPAFANVDLFCLSWFAPWGYDHFSGMMGLNMQHMISLVIIAYCMYGYVTLSSKMVVKITGAMGPSATGTAAGMYNAYEQSALGKVGLDKDSINKYKGDEKGRQKNRKDAVKAQDKRVEEQGKKKKEDK